MSLASQTSHSPILLPAALPCNILVSSAIPEIVQNIIYTQRDMVNCPIPQARSQATKCSAKLPKSTLKPLYVVCSKTRHNYVLKSGHFYNYFTFFRKSELILYQQLDYSVIMEFTSCRFLTESLTHSYRLLN